MGRIEKNRKATCANCQAPIDEYQIYCHVCGEETEMIPERLSAKLAVHAARKAFVAGSIVNLSFGIAWVVLFAVPLFICMAAFWNDYWPMTFSVLLLLPVGMIPYTLGNRLLEGRVTLSDFLKGFGHYPLLLILSFVAVFVVFVIKLVCAPEPLFTYPTDPILHLVRFVLNLWWVSIFMPIPWLVFRHGVNPFRAVVMAYRGCKHTRWQWFFLWLIMLVKSVGQICLLRFDRAFPLMFRTFLEYQLILERNRAFSLWDISSPER